MCCICIDQEASQLAEAQKINKNKENIRLRQEVEDLNQLVNKLRLQLKDLKSEIGSCVSFFGQFFKEITNNKRKADDFIHQINKSDSLDIFWKEKNHNKKFIIAFSSIERHSQDYHSEYYAYELANIYNLMIKTTQYLRQMNLFSIRFFRELQSILKGQGPSIFIRERDQIYHKLDRQLFKDYILGLEKLTVVAIQKGKNIEKEQIRQRQINSQILQYKEQSRIRVSSNAEVLLRLTQQKQTLSLQNQALKQKQEGEKTKIKYLEEGLQKEKQNIQKLRDELQRQKFNKRELRGEVARLTEMLGVKNGECDMLRRGLNQFQEGSMQREEFQNKLSLNSTLQSNLFKNNHNLKQLQTQLQQQKLKNQENLCEIRRLRTNLQQITRVIFSKDQEIKQLKFCLSQLKSNKITLDFQLNSLREEAISLKEEKELMQKQIDSLVSDFNRQKQTKKEVEIILQARIQEKKNLEEKINALQRRLSDQQNIRLRLEMKIDQQKTKVQYLQTRRIELQRQLQEGQKVLQNTKISLDKMKKNYEQMSRRQYSIETTQIEGTSGNRQKMKKLEREVNELKQLLKRQAEKLQFAKQQINSLKNQRFYSKSYVDHRTLMVGQALDDKYDEKIFLLRSIESHMKSEIIKTKLLYQYDKDNKTNFHTYVDGQKSFVAVVRTAKALIAGYYPGSLEEKEIMDGQGILISLTNKAIYHLNSEKNNKQKRKEKAQKKSFRALVYDKYYLIFGNAQIRIKAGEKKVFSNFGIMNSYYDNRKEKINSFLCEGEDREVPFEFFEIHQVFFNQDEGLGFPLEP